MHRETGEVTAAAAADINRTRVEGGRVIAVGTTVVRALESVTDERGTTSPGEGWTDVVVSAERPVRSVTGIITGLHEPRATHLLILEQVIAKALRIGSADTSSAARAASQLERAYAEAMERGYLWHEFGDSHLIIA